MVLKAVAEPAFRGRSAAMDFRKALGSTQRKTPLFELFFAAHFSAIIFRARR